MATREEIKQAQENDICPSWAKSVVSNYRHTLNIPKTISDAKIFLVWEVDGVCLMNTEEEKEEYLKEKLGL